MNTNPSLDSHAALLIFDPHEDTNWVRAIIAKERGRVSHLVMGGDYFDADRPGKVGGVESMCELLREIASEWGDRVTVLLGNHDIHYVEAGHWLRLQGKVPELRYQCGGFSEAKARAITKLLPAGFWAGCRLFQFINGWLVSHAGVAGCHWCPDLNPDLALEALDGLCGVALENIPHHEFAILQAGQMRGGHRPLGGITWLDFRHEFSDAEIPFRQIVGHTSSHGGARQSGRSWCLDGRQSCYGVLSRSGELEIVERP